MLFYIFVECNSLYLGQPVLLWTLFSLFFYMYIHLVRHKIAFACFNILSIQFLWAQLVHGEPPTNASDYSYIIIIVIGYFYKLCNKHIFITKALGVSSFFWDWWWKGTGQFDITELQLYLFAVAVDNFNLTRSIFLPFFFTLDDICWCMEKEAFWRFCVYVLISTLWMWFLNNKNPFPSNKHWIQNEMALWRTN